MPTLDLLLLFNNTIHLRQRPGMSVKPATSDFDIHESEVRILDYWQRRQQGLSEAEWVDFYQRVTPILMATQLPSEFSQRRAREDLVNLFFTEKIFLNATTSQAGPLRSVHVLHIYLKRFALDLLGRWQSIGAVEVPQSGADGESLVENAAAELTLNHAQILLEAGIDATRASASATRFLQSLDPADVAYLRHHSCADEEDREPLSAIAQRLAIGSSYHYRARTLGITRSKGETYAGYENTKIGGWLLSVGAALAQDWQMELAVLLILLCLQVQALERAP